MQKFEEPVQNLRGDVIAMASMLVMVAGTDTPATIFADAGGQQQITDPRTDKTGIFAFYASNGRYDIYVVINGQRVAHKTDIALYDQADDPNDPVKLVDALSEDLANTGLDKVGGTWFGNVQRKLSALATLAGASLIGFIQAGTGAIARSIQDKMRESVSVLDFGVKGDGTLEDLAALQAAVAAASKDGLARTLYFPPGSYMLPDTFRIPASAKGIVLKGASWRGSYLKTPANSTFDMIHVAAAYTRISGFMWRPGGVQAGVRLFAPNCEISRNQALASTNNAGSFILLGDTDPAEVIAPGGSATVLSGCYTHVIDKNVVGVAGYAFAHVVEDASVAGIQSCKITNNTVTCNGAFKISKGGANFYEGNQIQASTAGVGSGIECGPGVVSEKIGYNYFEGLANGVLLRQTDETNPAAYVAFGHFDNCTNKVYSLGTRNYVFDDAGNKSTFRNGWTDIWSSLLLRVFNGPSNGTPILTLDDGNKAIKVNRVYSDMNVLAYNADGLTLTPTSHFMQVHGSGAARVNCVLGKVNTDKPYELKLVGMTWPVTILNTNCHFLTNAASVTFGNATGNIMMMRLTYMPTLGLWVEESRTTY